jgi:hypothetical protein
MTQLLYRHQSLKEAVQLAAAEVQTNQELVDAILSRVIIEAMKRYQQKVNVGVQDSVADLLDTFKQKVAESVFSVADEWTAANPGLEPILYPKGCRFCYSHGDNTIVVIEEDPKIRSLSFDGGMAGHTFEYGHDDSRRFTLALPYVIFLAHFKNGRFQFLYSGWRTRSLVSLNDLVVKPLLPNIHDNLQACLGRYADVGNQVEDTPNIITRFWNSRFNNDLSDTWWNKGIASDKVATAESWVRASQENPMFILDVELENVRGTKTVQSLLDLLCGMDETPDVSGCRHRLSEEIDRCVATLFHKIFRYFKKVKFDRHCPSDVAENLGKITQGAVGELSDVVCALEIEINRWTAQLNQQPETQVRSEVWNEYDCS